MNAVRFTSALYLGLGHPTDALPAWASITRGAPAAVDEPALARDVAARAARILGTDAAVVATSTLHLAIDLFPMLAPRGSIVYADASLYPISSWGLERAAARGASVRSFPAHDARALGAMMARDAPFARPPLVVADGYCPSCGRAAPLRAYSDLIRARRGLLVVDDTQALGVLGRGPTLAHPYGLGGGGALASAEVHGRHVVVMASLAKAFGAPAAVLAARRSIIDGFRDKASTRLHCSPPSTPALLSARRALAINDAVGDALRRRLAQRVDRFRSGVARTGLLRSRSLFPVQSLAIPRSIDGTALLQEIERRGVLALLTRRHERPRNGNAVALTLLITAAHSTDAIDCATAAIVAALGKPARPARPARSASLSAHAHAAAG